METMNDELNPAFIFRLTWNELLVKIARGEINAKEIAKKELKNRGFNGKWIGFKDELH